LPTVAELTVAVNLFFAFFSPAYCASGGIGVKTTFGIVIPSPSASRWL